MQIGDWMALAVAIATSLLAVVTYVLALYTRKLADASVKSIALLREQTDAIRKQADTSERAFTAAQEQFRRQSRAYVVWDSANERASVRDDPLHWPDGKIDGITAALSTHVRNVGPVPAYLDRVEHDERVRLVIIAQPYLPPNAFSEVTIYIPMQEGAELDIGAELLTLRFRSLLSDEPGKAEAVLGGRGTVGPADGHGDRSLDGYFMTTPLA